MTIKNLAQRLRSLAALLDTLDTEVTEITVDLNTLTAVAVPVIDEPKLHWTKRPENARKLARIQRKRLATRAKNGRAAKAKVAKVKKVKRAKLHWTQRPENRAKVIRMNRKTAKLVAAA